MVTVNLSELDSYTAYIVSGFHCEDTLIQRVRRVHAAVVSRRKSCHVGSDYRTFYYFVISLTNIIPTFKAWLQYSQYSFWLLL